MRISIKSCRTSARSPALIPDDDAGAELVVNDAELLIWTLLAEVIEADEPLLMLDADWDGLDDAMPDEPTDSD